VTRDGIERNYNIATVPFKVILDVRSGLGKRSGTKYLRS
jgi:hypothetical protein